MKRSRIGQKFHAKCAHIAQGRLFLVALMKAIMNHEKWGEEIQNILSIGFSSNFYSFLVFHENPIQRLIDDTNPMNDTVFSICVMNGVVDGCLVVNTKTQSLIYGK